METASIEITSIRRRNDMEKSTWRTHRYFVVFESGIQVEISTSNRCHNFHVDSSFNIDLISTNFPCGISTSNQWQIDEDVSIGLYPFLLLNTYLLLILLIQNILNIWNRITTIGNSNLSFHVGAIILSLLFLYYFLIVFHV